MTPSEQDLVSVSSPIPILPTTGVTKNDSASRADTPGSDQPAPLRQGTGSASTLEAPELHDAPRETSDQAAASTSAVRDPVGSSRSTPTVLATESVTVQLSPNGEALAPARIINSTPPVVVPSAQAPTARSPARIVNSTPPVVVPSAQAPTARSPARTQLADPVDIPPPPPTYTSIDTLAPNLTDWTLLGRVLCRSAIRTWKTVRGSGKVFDFRIIDNHGDTIKASVFGNGVDMFDRVLRNGATCTFAGGKVKSCDKRFSSESLELAFDHRASISASTRDLVTAALATPTITITDIADVAAGSKVSVAGIVHQADGCKTFVNAAGESRYKRDLLIVDDTFAKVVITVWSFQAKQDITEFVGKLAVVHLATVNDYQETRSLSALGGSTIFFDPSLDQFEQLKLWYASQPDENAFKFVPSPAPNAG